MRITKRQLRRMVTEAMPHGGVPDVVGAVTGVPQGNIQNLVEEYKEWAVEYMGTPSGANSASVLATFIVDKGLDQGVSGEGIIRDMTRAMRFDSVDVRKEVTRQRAEYDAGGTLSDQEIHDRGFKESRGRLRLMKITKRQLKRIIREEVAKSTEKYDDDSALTGDQDELPDALQKGIIDKTVDERDAEKNESLSITKRRLRNIIKEALTGPPETLEEWMYWGGEWNLDSDYDGEGQMMFYTYDQAMVDEAEKAGAAIERDNEGQFVIYTGVYDPNEEGF